ncbi:MAG: glycosyltransferase [Candidatus Portnoybacteria bacterium]|nr:glycosyltransferase [Candidatus Portnoybacteria bacterium]
MDLSIVILSWNTKALTRNCLRSIFDNVKDIAFETIVVDNDSSDGSADMVAREFPQIKLIRNSENLGFTKGNNQGFKESEGEYILFLNSDTITPPPDFDSVILAEAGIQKANIERNADALNPRLRGGDNRRSDSDDKKSQLRKMVDKMHEDKSIGMLTPKLIYPDGKFQDEYYRKLPSITQTFWVYLAPFNKLTHRIKFLRKRFLSDLDPNKSRYADDFNIPGAAPLMSREAHKKIGGRDENIFYWLEDVDLCWSLKKAGYKLYYLADATIIHLGGRSNAMWEDLRKMLDFRRGYVYVFRKHKGKFQGFIVKWMFILDALLLIFPVFAIGLFAKKYRGKANVFWQFALKFLKT